MSNSIKIKKPKQKFAKAPFSGLTQSFKSVEEVRTAMTADTMMSPAGRKMVWGAPGVSRGDVLASVDETKQFRRSPEEQKNLADWQANYTQDRGYQGPKRADKGIAGGSCNVTACQRPDSAFFYNHSTQAHYCLGCARKINGANRHDQYVRDLGHDLCTLDPQFADKI